MSYFKLIITNHGVNPVQTTLKEIPTLHDLFTMIMSEDLLHDSNLHFEIEKSPGIKVWSDAEVRQTAQQRYPGVFHAESQAKSRDIAAGSMRCALKAPRNVIDGNRDD